jgi:hypothetical protein
MIRPSLNHLAMFSWPALFILSATLVACGSDSGASKASTSGSTASGSTASASSGSKGSSGGAEHDAATESSGSALATSKGCGQGTSCTPGEDLVAPAAADGFQIETPDSAIAVQPNQEAFLCFYKTVPNTAAVDIGTMQSWMTPSSSHHFIAYQIASGGGGAFGGGQQPDGTLQTCRFGGGTWMYATSVPGQVIEMKMPDKVGLPIAAGTQIMLNMHFINPGTTTAYPQVKMNFLYAQNVQYKAAAMISFNTSINVPPATASGPGTQTVSGTCNPVAGSKFFIMTSHTHKHATTTDVSYVSAGNTTRVVHTTDWEHPDVALWSAPNFLTVQSGDKFTYSCTYSNPGTSAVTVGETAASNEMCMAIGYYFPAGNAFCL